MDVGYWLYPVKARMVKFARHAEQHSPFVLNRIKPITKIINLLLSLFCIPTNDGSVKYIVTVSFDYIVRLIDTNKPSCDDPHECVPSKAVIVIV